MEKIFFIIPVVLTATAWLFLLTTLAPQVSLEKEVSLKILPLNFLYLSLFCVLKTKLQFPGNLQELQDLAKLMAAYYKENWAYVLVLFSSAYLYKQSFMIPGSVLLVQNLV
jgi:hypothetical protein